MRQPSRMNRGLRVARGAFGSAAATLLAAASHALAGGTITGPSVIATALIALPLCVLLAGRVGSLWRLSSAVGAAQFLYHWTFAGLGLPYAEPTAAASMHAAHSSALATFTPALAEAGTADLWMWLSHGFAAAATILLLHRGERAALALLRLVRRLVFTRVLLPVEPRPRPLLTGVHIAGVRLRCLSPAAITHRGPPLAA